MNSLITEPSAGRKTSLPFAFAYDSGGAQHLQNIGPLGAVSWADNYAYLARGGWSYSLPMLSESLVKENLVVGGGKCVYFSFFVFQDPTGGRHHLGLAIDLNDPPSNCPNATPVVPSQVFSGGDDYYKAALTTTTAPLLIADADGTVYSIPYTSLAHSNLNGSYSMLPTAIEDRNGNKINVNDNGSGSVSVTDTLGRTMLSTSGFAASTDTITVSGLTNSYTATWGSASANHAVGSSLIWSDGIGCPSIPALKPTSVINQITLPNNTSYVFSYDPNYGTLNKITYPSGGFVSYTWTMNSLSEFVSLADQNGNLDGCAWKYDVPAVAQRSVSFDGVHIALQQNFTYSTTGMGVGGWAGKTTTVTTTDNITGLTYSTVYTYTPYNEFGDPNDWSTYEPQIPLEQSVVTKNSSGTTIRTVNKTWFDQYELASEQTTLENGFISKSSYTYGPGAQITSKSDYDFPSGTALLRKTATNYQAFNATPIYPSGASIFDSPCQTIVYDSSGSNRVAETDYLFDGGTSVCGTAGTPR